MCSEPYISSNGFYIHFINQNLDFINGKFIICQKATSIIYPFQALLQFKKASNFEFSFVIDWHPDKNDNKSYTAFFGRYYQELNKINLKWALWYKKAERKEIVYSGHDSLNKANFQEVENISSPIDIYKVPHPFYFKTQLTHNQSLT